MNKVRQQLKVEKSTASPLDDEIRALYATFVADRPAGADEDTHMLTAIADHIIERCSKPGDIVFDPFAGYGTTLNRALALGRQAMGIELLPDRVDYLREHFPQAQILEGDSRELLNLVRGRNPDQPHTPVDMVLASPPYMTATDHEADPLTGYVLNNGDYDRYLSELELIAAQCARVVAPGGYVVWNLADIHHQGRTTHLIRDCARVLQRHLKPVGVSEIIWDRYPHDLIADALLVFQRPEVA